jgi:Integrase core domain
MTSDLNQWSQECLSCQKSKVHTHISPPSQPIPIPSRYFSHIHIDIVGPLPPSQGHTHIFNMIDHTTRWLEAIPLLSTSSKSCAEALISSWISRFGIPHTIKSDRGSQFTSSIWHSLSSLLNISNIHTTALLFILNPTALLKECTESSKLPSLPDVPHLIGLPIFPGSSFPTMPHLMTNPTSL